MPDKPLSESQLIDAYRGVRRHDTVPDALMPGHMHVYRRGGGDSKFSQRILVWHTHPGYTIRHRLEVGDAHPEGDPRRMTLRTYDKKTLEEV